MARIHARHGVILNCMLESSSGDSKVEQSLRELGGVLQGQKYAFVEESRLGLDSTGDSVKSDVWGWLNEAMST